MRQTFEGKPKTEPAHRRIPGPLSRGYDGGWVIQGGEDDGEFVVGYGVEVGDYVELFCVEG